MNPVNKNFTCAVISANVSLILTFAFPAGVARGDQPTYKATRQSVDGGGMLRSTDGSLELSGTFAQPDTAILSGGDLELSGGFWFRLSPTDCDEDGIVGFLDFLQLQDCVTGPNGFVSSGCRCLDVYVSGTVDLRDAATFQREFNVPTAPPSEPGLTTVEGLVYDVDGMPVAEATVGIPEQPGRVTETNPNGRFIILNVATTQGLIHVKASKIMDGLLATGAVTGITPCANDITEAGVITITVNGVDSDGDKLPDAIELALGYDPSMADSDGNGIVDGLEDLDVDGVVNCLEVVLGTNLTEPDTDHDFLDDAQELQFRTDPLLVDTDSDGIIDGEEVEFNSDPLSTLSLPATVLQRFGHLVGWVASTEQRGAPSANIPMRIAFAPAPFALENAAPPPPLHLLATEAFGPLLGVDNQNAP